MAKAKSTEQRLRRLARRKGYRLLKSRVREPHSNDHGGYQIVHGNIVKEGDRYTLTLDGAADALDRLPAH